MRLTDRSFPSALFPPLLAAAIVFLAGCGGAEDAGGTSGSAVESQAREEAREQRRARRGEDRGEASMDVAGTTWTSDTARARKRDSGALRISAGSTQVDGEKVTGEQLNLLIGQYQGPGSYPAQAGSMWVRVGFNAAEAAQADGSPDALNEVLSGATTVQLMQATIEVASEEDGFITGSFRLPAAAAPGGKEITGSFRARIRD